MNVESLAGRIDSGRCVSFPMLDDGSVLEQARRGDEAAWRHLYESNADMVFRLALRMVGDREAALDVLQETYIRAARALSGFRGDAKFRSWIARIAINEARTWLRKKTRRREVSLDVLPGRADGGLPVDEQVARADLAQRALELARTLPDRQRDAVILRTTEGYSYREIAEMLGTSEGSVRVSYHHGMAKLRERLADVTTSPGQTHGEDQERPDHPRPRNEAI